MAEMQMVECPKCGHVNETSAGNCSNCRVNLAWAIENWEQHAEAEARREAAQAQQKRVARPAAEVGALLTAGLVVYFLLGVPVNVLASRASDIPANLFVPLYFLAVLIGWGFTTLAVSGRREAHPEVARQRPGLDFWLLWVLATVVGVSVYSGLSAIPDRLAEGQMEPLGSIAFAAVVGALLGIAQWPVLRRHVKPAGWWIAASAIGFGAGQAWAEAIGLNTTLIALAIVQWWGLRLYVRRAGWWIPGSALSLAAARLVILPFVLIAERFFVTAGPAVVIATSAALGVPFGVVSGAATGGLLIWLLRQPAPLSSPSYDSSIIELGLKKQKTIHVDCSPEAAYELAQETLGRLGWKTDESDAQDGILRAKVGIGLRSMGEQIEVRVQEAEPGDCSLVVSSEPRMQTILVDWGKNVENVRRFEEVLLTLV